MKIAQNFVLLTLYLLISGCGLILDIACLASGTHRTVSEEDKSDAQRDMEKMHKDMQRHQDEMQERSRRENEEMKRQRDEDNRRFNEHARDVMESIKRGDLVKIPKKD